MGVNQFLNGPANRIKELEKMLEVAERTIDRLRAPRKQAFRKSRCKASKGGFLRVIFGDLHGAYAEPAAVNAFLADVAELKPRELICVGDLLSCDGFLAEHHTINVLPQLDYTYENDTQVTNEFLDRLATAAGVTCQRTEYIEGNHENRIIRTITNRITKHPRDAKFIEAQLGPANVLHLEKRAMRFVRRHEYYDGLSISGTIRLDPHAVAQHGEAYCGVNASRQLLSALGKNVFHGHTHRLSAVYGENISDSLVAINTACLCQKRPLYGLTKPTGWMNGYAIQFVKPGAGFLALPVPIIDGVSYLAPLLSLLKM